MIRGRSLEDFNNLVNLLSSTTFKISGSDSWTWTWDNTGMFTVGKLSKRVNEKISRASATGGAKSFWSKIVPRKVNIFNWRMLNNALPTKNNLVRRGVPLDSILYDFYVGHEESLDHCLFKCHSVEPIWRKIWGWWGISSPRPLSADDFRNLVCCSHKKGRLDLLFKSICGITTWAIWKWRNRVVHADIGLKEKVKNGDIFPEIQRISALWFDNRCVNCNFKFDKWISSPLEALA